MFWELNNSEALLKRQTSCMTEDNYLHIWSGAQSNTDANDDEVTQKRMCLAMNNLVRFLYLFICFIYYLIFVYERQKNFILLRFFAIPLIYILISLAARSCRLVKIDSFMFIHYSIDLAGYILFKISDTLIFVTSLLY